MLQASGFGIWVPASRQAKYGLPTDLIEER